MKAIKNILAVLLCLVMLFSFAACRDKDADTDEQSTQPTVQTYESPKSLEDIGLSLAKLESANKIKSLMEKYGVITVKGESSDGASYIRQLFRSGDGIACISKSADTVSGFIRGFDFVVEKDRVKAYCDIEDIEKGGDFDDDDLIAELFEGKELVAVEEAEKYYKLESLSEDKEKAGKRLFTFDKGSLALTSVVYENAVGNTEKVEITYNGELEEFAKKIVESFEGELKKIKLKGEIIDDGTVIQLDTELSLPADWEYVPSGDGRIDYYMNEAMNEAYAYPGNGKDYTLYISNIFEEDDNGKK